MDEKTTHFGFRDVPVDEKKKLVGEVFSSVAGQVRPDERPDVARRASGVEALFRRHLAACKRGDRVLDLAGGTGDIAALLLERVGDERRGGDRRHQCGDAQRRPRPPDRPRPRARLELRADAMPRRCRSRMPVSTWSPSPSACATSPTRTAALREMHRVLKARRPRAGAGVLAGAEPNGSSRSTTSIRSRCCRSWASCSPTMPTATSTWPNRSASIRRRRRCKAMMEEAGFERCDVPQPQRRHRRHPLAATASDPP